MKHFRSEERGQTLVEFAIILSLLMMLTAGLVDVGRAFYQYNALSAAARYGARWGSVVGGMCAPYNGNIGSSNDWCNLIGTSTSSVLNPFWSAAGNIPVQASGTSCPSSASGADGTNSYKVSDYLGSSSTTIVGAIAHRFDTDSSHTNMIRGVLMPGFDLSQVRVCIQMSPDAWHSSTSQWAPEPGSSIRVVVYTTFNTAGSLLPAVSIPMAASAQYTVE